MMTPITWLLLIFIPWLATAAWSQPAPSPVQRGKAIFHATGGCGCHTDVKNKGAFMAGGRPIATPFGSIYATNITPDLETGIGNWSDEAFIAAMTRGLSPDGKHYFPVFPYTSFTRMARRDLLDLKAYLFSIPPIRQANRPTKLRFPFGWRGALLGWKWFNFQPGPLQPTEGQSDAWNRGAYLVQALAHCGECHTPRNLMGGLNASMSYAGAVEGPEGELAPNITPDEATGIGDWSEADIVWYLQTGLKPDGDDTQGLMSEVIEHGYQHVPEADLKAIATYLRTLKPIVNKVVPKAK